MSNGNMLLGYARGKVGSLVFSRNKGKQVTAAYNSSPSNPRSESQMTQRATFLGVQKFFTKGRQAFFRFAFEDKKTSESEFAAFMRNNMKRGVMISKAAFDNPTYPALGNFIMTKGTLGVIMPKSISGASGWKLQLDTLPNAATFGNLSQSFIKEFGAMDGDLITVLTIVATDSDASNTPRFDPDDHGPINWRIFQSRVDSHSIETISSQLGSFVMGGTKSLNIDTGEDKSIVQGCCICISRQTKRGLKVSTSYLVPNDATQLIIQFAKEEEYVKGVLDSWGSTAQAILQGNPDL